MGNSSKGVTTSTALIVIAVGTIGAIWVGLQLKESADEERVERAAAAATEAESDRATALAVLGGLKPESPADLWTAKCADVERKGGVVPSTKRESCALAFAKVGRELLRKGAVADARDALEDAKRFGAADVDGPLADASKRAAAAKQAEEKAAAAEAAKARALAADVGPRPTTFPRTGGCVECEVALDTALKDPDSFERMTVTEPEIVSKGKLGKAWRVQMKFRARNGFGASDVGVRNFYIKRGVVALIE